jgi:hypothetical protein
MAAARRATDTGVIKRKKNPNLAALYAASREAACDAPATVERRTRRPR